MVLSSVISHGIRLRRLPVTGDRLQVFVARIVCPITGNLQPVTGNR